jgi:fluoride exporter
MADDEPEPNVVPIDPDLAPSDPAEPSAEHRPSRRQRHGRARPDVLAAIALGGALGAPVRFEVTQLIKVPAGGFPWDIFWINITGSLVLGFLLVLIIERLPPSRYLRPFFAVGFLGAYTTYSTYMVGASTLIKDGHAATGVIYLFASALAGFAAVWIGIISGRLLPIAPRRRGVAA